MKIEQDTKEKGMQTAYPFIMRRGAQMKLLLLQRALRAASREKVSLARFDARARKSILPYMTDTGEI